MSFELVFEGRGGHGLGKPEIRTEIEYFLEFWFGFLDYNWFSDLLYKISDFELDLRFGI